MTDRIASYEPVILVTRGDELPKKNYERKLHPTYETSIRIKNNGNKQLTTPHYVVKFYDQYKELYEALRKLGIGENMQIHIDAPFPQKYAKSQFGGQLTEQELQHRCYLLNKWMTAIFNDYPAFPPKAQALISDFLSLHDDDAALEQNKELILSLLRKKREREINGSFSRPPSRSGSIQDPGGPKQNATAATAGGGGGEGDKQLGKSGSTISNPGNPGLTSDNLAALQSRPLIDPAAMSVSLPESGEVGDRVKEMSESELLECEKPMAVNNYMSCHVRKGETMLAKPGDSKLHMSYELTLRMLPLSEVLNVPDRRTVNEELYRQHRSLPPVQVVKVFDAYRALKDDLEMCHVYALDDIQEANEARDRGFTIVVVQAHFPRTLKRSALGINIPAKEVRRRVALLNRWFGMLLNLYSVMPLDARNMIAEFLEITQEMEEEGEISLQCAIAHSILHNSYELPRIEVRVAPKKRSSYFFGSPSSNTSGGGASGAGKDSDTESGTDAYSYGKMRRSNSASAMADAQTVASDFRREQLQQKSGSFTAGFAANGRKNSAMSSFQSEVDGRETLYQDMTNMAAVEVQVGQFLGVSVCRGEPIAKKIGEKPTHPAYEILLRILSLGEVVMAEKDKVLTDAYNAHVEMGPLRCPHVFDEYRALRMALEEEYVFALDRMTEAEAAREHGKRVVLVERDFPRTYKRQSLGIKLKEHQLHRRMVMLNDWMGALLQAFPIMPPVAQRLVIEFLSKPGGALALQTEAAAANARSPRSKSRISEEGEGYEEDEAAAAANAAAAAAEAALTEKRNEIIFAMLRRTFVPQKIPDRPPERGGGGGGSANKKGSKSQGLRQSSNDNLRSASSGNLSSRGKGVGGGGDQPGAGDPGTQQACCAPGCAIM